MRLQRGVAEKSRQRVHSADTKSEFVSEGVFGVAVTSLTCKCSRWQFAISKSL